MCFSCHKKKVWHMISNRMTDQPIKFDSNEIEELRKKFNKVAGKNKIIDTDAFKKNMGILGLRSAHEFSQRLFNSFDIDNDGYVVVCQTQISFQDFLQYMQVLKCGSDKNRAKISFKLIDHQNKNYINVDDFREFLSDFFMSWSSITNVSISHDIKERTNQYVHLIFNKVKKDQKTSEIDFKYYSQKLYKDKQFIQAFDFITEGVASIFLPQSPHYPESVAASHSKILYKVLKQLNKINNTVFQMTNKESNMFKKVCQEQLPKKVPPFIVQMSKNLRKMQSKANSINPYSKEVHTPIKQSINSSSKQKQSLNFDLMNDQSMQRDKKTAMMQQLNDLIRNRQSWTNCYSRLKQKTGQDVGNNSLVLMYEKKLSYIKSKLQKLVNETENVFNFLVDKFENIKNQYVPNLKEAGMNVHKKIKNNSSTGTMVFFGDDNWNMVLNMMIGIQMAVRSVRGYQQVIYEEPKDFGLKYYFELVPRRFGGESYQSTIYSFTDYAPNTFNRIRKIFNIDNEQYIGSIGPNRLMTSLLMGEVSTMTSLTSQGKSGSFFYYTADNKYMLKTIHYRQYVFMKKILQDYYFYIKDNPKTLISKFFGLHKLIQKNQQGNTIGKSYFVIMGNVFNTRDKIIQRYDIKGSSYGRQNNDTDPKATKKDNDFKKRQPLNINQQQLKQLIEIIKNDKEFFRKHDIIDYSLLIGVIGHHSDSVRNTNESIRFTSQKDKSPKVYQSTVKNQKYIFGIIDYLTQYNSLKMMQYYFKRVFYGQGISAVPPDDYAARFINFIQQEIFTQRIQGDAVQIRFNQQ